MRSALLAIVTLGVTYGCATGIPRVGGEPVAPAMPERLWRPPAAARVRDSLTAPDPLPLELAARAKSLTLSDVVDLALRDNPATRVSWAQARAAADAYGASRAAYLPSVSGALGLTRSVSPGAPSVSGSADGASGSGGSGPRNALSSSLNLGYLVFDFGGRGGAVEEARAAAFAAAYTHNRVIQATVLQVEQAYFQYVGTRALRDAQRESVAEARASYDGARKRDSVGLATIADVLQARTALGQAELQLQSYDGQLQTTRSSLSLALGVSPTAPYDVAANAADVPVDEVTASVDALIDRALRERPDLQSAYASAAAARAAIRVARSARLPSLALSAQDAYQRSSVASLSGTGYSLSLGVQVPLFDGEASAYGLARARALADAAAAQAASARQTVIADVYSAYYVLQTGAQQVRTSDELLASADAAMRAARAQYAAGLVRIVDLLGAQAALASARAQQAQARWSWAQSLANLGYAAGALDVGGRVDIPIAGRSTRPIPP